MTETQKHFHDFLSANNILCNVKCADRDELLRLLLSTLKRHHPGLDLDLAAREVKEREELFRRAEAFALGCGSRSPRAAGQFIDSLMIQGAV